MKCRILLSLILCSTARLFAAEYEFNYKRPDAESVSVMSEFNGWKALPMTKGSDGTWKAKVTLPAGTYAYKFLVNGTEWVFDPDNSKRKTADGVENSAVEVAETTTQPSPAATRATGTPSSTRLSTAPSPSASTTATLSAVAGEISTVEVPLSDARRAEAAKDGNAKLMHARVAIAVPPGFDPQKTWPVLVVSNTETYSNIDSLRQFKDAANDAGWVVLAADAVEADKDKEGSWRYPCAGAAFDYLTNAWPGSQNWPVACGGMSGGAKNSALLAGELGREHHRIIGLLMMGCNQDMATVALHKYAPPNFLQAAVFLSSGKSDTIATPRQTEYVKNSLHGSGFMKLRLETFDGGHDIYQPHIGEALRWFAAQGSPNPSATPRKSDLDSFKKL